MATTASASLGEPIQLVNFGDNGLGPAVLTEDGEKFLRTISQPVAPVCITGVLRSGKSFFMSKVLGQASVFSVGHKITGHTRGIWVWSHGLDVGGRMLLAMDCEGLFEVSQASSMQKDMRLFAISVLLSSMLILNMRCTIDTGPLKQLNFACKLIRSMRDNALEEGIPQTSIAEPDLSFLIRDASLDLGQFASYKDYMEGVLTPDQKASPDVNKVRALIQECFQRRHCFALPYPVAEERHLKLLDSDPSLMVPEFRDAVQEVVQSVRCAAAKQIASPTGHLKTLTGAELADYARAVVHQVNRGTPSIGGLHDIVVQAEFARNLKESEEQWLAAMEQFMTQAPVEEGRLLDFANKLFEEIVQKFVASVHSSKKVTAADDLKELVMPVRETGVGGHLAVFLGRNHDMSNTHCQETFKVVCVRFPLKQHAEQRKFADQQVFEKAASEAEKLFNSQVRGPAIASWQLQLTTFVKEARAIVWNQLCLEPQQLKLRQQEAEARQIARETEETRLRVAAFAKAAVEQDAANTRRLDQLARDIEEAARKSAAEAEQRKRDFERQLRESQEAARAQAEAEMAARQAEYDRQEAQANARMAAAAQAQRAELQAMQERNAQQAREFESARRRADAEARAEQERLEAVQQDKFEKQQIRLKEKEVQMLKDQCRQLKEARRLQKRRAAEVAEAQRRANSSSCCVM